MTVVWVSSVLSEIVFATSFSFSCLPPRPWFCFFCFPFLSPCWWILLATTFPTPKWFQFVKLPTPYSFLLNWRSFLLNWRTIERHSSQLEGNTKKRKSGVGEGGRRASHHDLWNDGCHEAFTQSSDHTLSASNPRQYPDQCEREEKGWMGLFSLFFWKWKKIFFFSAKLSRVTCLTAWQRVFFFF